MGKKLSLNADESAATVATATVGDAFTTLASSTVAVTGMEKFLQLGTMFVGGMVAQNIRLGNGANIFRSV